MRLGLLISILLHAAIIAFAIIEIGRSTPFFEQPDIPVEVVTVADFDNVKAAAKVKEPEKEAEPEPQVEPPPAAAAPPEPEPEAAEEPAPPEPDKTVEAKPSPKDSVKPQRKPKPPAKDKEKDEKFDLDQIAVLLNKEQKEQEKQQTSEESPGETSDEPRESVGEGTDMTMTLIQSMKRQVERCWSFPAGAVQPEKLDVYILIALREDGTMAEPPAIENQSQLANPYFKAAAEAAVRALAQCQPYDLPVDQYDVWKEIRLNFDPGRMIGL